MVIKGNEWWVDRLWLRSQSYFWGRIIFNKLLDVDVLRLLFISFGDVYESLTCGLRITEAYELLTEKGEQYVA